MKRLIFLGVVMAFAASAAMAAGSLKKDSFDPKTGTWKYYRDGKLLRTARDTNQDGRPDRFTLFVKGRNLVLKETDGNFDGKIDRRALVEWDANKKMTIMTDRVERIPVPGYRTLWKEEDRNFDGIIDAYYERGKKDAASKKIGRPMDGALTGRSPEQRPVNP